MSRFMKVAAAVALTGAIALAAASPSEARHGRNAAAAIGFGAGALLGAAVANSNNGYYRDGYYGEPVYYGSGSYAYEPRYEGRSYRRGAEHTDQFGNPIPSCANLGLYGRVDYGAC